MPRCTLLFVIEGELLRESIRASCELADEYQRLMPQVMEVSKSEIFAVGEAPRIQRRMRLPHPLDDCSSAATSAGPIHALWSPAGWWTPGDCPPAPPDSNGATAWQWAHYGTVMKASRDAHLILWDLYIRHVGNELAA
ncbi:hypothetical protein ACTXOR_02940 [Arthrobacter rhombi]|uniref:Uncharacterized protein n=1 Tax=Arthrobacter rhombi TaxID=71253 RepID=A0A1R4GEX7_9MICC|nr:MULTISPECIES: hypothetical protein [Micrococcaceae]PCC25942.1 hypothetical protein CIK75_05605 [Glutamicibacter sp. BW78]SJM66683.1 hypothetical protein FM101_09980 [Arthrobacter rhombi]